MKLIAASPEQMRIASHRGFVTGTAINRDGRNIVVQRSTYNVRRCSIQLGITQNPGSLKGNPITAFVVRIRRSIYVRNQGVLVIAGVYLPGQLKLFEIVEAGCGLSLSFRFA